MVSLTNTQVASGAITRPQISISREQTKAKLDPRRLFWVIVFGAVMGFVVETVYCIIKNGRFEWRGSMMFLPFNAVYGLGALALTLITMNTSQIRNRYIFIAGAVTGTLVEFACSFVQQHIFGSVSWDYSRLPLNIGGRVCLLFTVFWGILAVLWARVISPRFERIYAALPQKIMKPLTAALFLLIIVSVALSALAVARWGARVDGVTAVTNRDLWFDRIFTDDVMKTFYANMKFLA
jgi:uncharacterized membrane protein